MKKKIIPIILFIITSLVFCFWTTEMTASKPDTLKFYLIFLPLQIFLVLEFYFILKIRSSPENKATSKLVSFFIIPLVLFLFLFFSFGEHTNKICFSGDCDNGYGVALYIKSERTTKSANESNDGELQYYEPEFLGRNWFNNIVWFDGNPITHVYMGEFKNGYFHGKGQEFYFTYEYEKNHKYDANYKFIDGIYLVRGEWERGWLFWDKESRSNGHIEMNDDITKILLDYNIDQKGYYKGK
jgi:hypothetical protein